MEEEDIGRRPLEEEPEGYPALVRRRITQGRTWVIEQRGEILFQINLGTTTRWGVQIGGTYVPPEHRNQGWATRGVLQLVGMLLKKHPTVTLHVNEINTPAVRVYERIGLPSPRPYRLVTVPPR